MERTLLDLTITIGQRTGASAFEVMESDHEDVIAFANHFIETAEGAKPARPERVKVNDRTATGGWY